VVLKLTPRDGSIIRFEALTLGLIGRSVLAAASACCRGIVTITVPSTNQEVLVLQQ
jgi:hypothetical protein